MSKTHVVKIRRGKPILVDKQIGRWRKRRAQRKEAAALALEAQGLKEQADALRKMPLDALGCPRIKKHRAPKGSVAKTSLNPFWSEDDNGSN